MQKFNANTFESQFSHIVFEQTLEFMGMPLKLKTKFNSMQLNKTNGSCLVSS